jgi:HEAT repeat protein
LGVICLLLAIPGFSQNTPPAAPTEASPQPAVVPQKSKLTPQQKAWQILRNGAGAHKTDERVMAVRALSLLKGQTRAVILAEKALKDPKPEVRTAGAYALGEMHAKSAIPQLKVALEDKELPVVLASARALILMRDPNGYQVYFEILTGERKATSGLVAGEMETLRDPKKLAVLGFEGGIGFVPYGGIGYTAIKTIIKDDTSPVRAAAAKLLTDDPDPETTKALAEKCLTDKNELVRSAALEAIAKRRDPGLMEKIVPAMDDNKEVVRYTAAAAVISLSAIGSGSHKRAK